MTSRDFLDTPPFETSLTDYDRAHLGAYLRLLDAEADGADWADAVTAIFGLDVLRDPDRARRVHDSHLERARWMTEHGYRDLLRDGRA